MSRAIKHNKKDTPFYGLYGPNQPKLHMAYLMIEGASTIVVYGKHLFS